MKDSAPSITNSLDLEVTMVIQNTIVIGEIIEAKDKKKLKIIKEEKVFFQKEMKY